MENLAEKLIELRGKVVILPGNAVALAQLDEIIEGLNDPESYAMKPPPLTPPKRDK